MKYVVDTDELSVRTIRTPLQTIADLMEEHIGETEYNVFVNTIQTWYYGRVVQAAWCATGLSYFAEHAGVSSQTGKHENVDRMKDYLTVNGKFYYTKNYKSSSTYKPKRGDVVFMSSKKIQSDCTHVGVVSAVDNTAGTLCVCSCNIDSKGRKDGIYLNTYNYLTDKYIVGFGKIEY